VNDFLILSAIFVAILIFSMVVSTLVTSRAEISARVDETARRKESGEFVTLIPGSITGISRENYTLIENYFTVVRQGTDPNSLKFRLVRAGFFSNGAPLIFQAIRALLSFGVLVGCFVLIRYLLPEQTITLVVIASMFVAAIVFFVTNIVLEWRGDKKERSFRKLFPDFMDTLIVCLDAGLSIEAAVDRVSKEFLSSDRDFGIHLVIMMLEVRGGRRLREALQNFSERVRIPEARSLATLLRQSEELGTSVTKALRVYSNEMRQMRMIRAEEKANTLPIKMLFPLALFLFPMSILIVLVPVVMKVLALIGQIANG